MPVDPQHLLILDQFTRQALPFSEMHARDDAEIHQLLITAADITSNDDVLDVACGPGLVACEVAKIARHVTGIDLTPAMIEQARTRCRDLSNVSWTVGDAEQLPFPDSRFSRVITRYSFHHCTNPKRVFREMLRVSTGRVTIADVFTTSPEQAEAYDRLEKWRDPSHTHALQLTELQTLFDGMTDIRCEFYLYPVTVDNLLARSFPNPGGADAFRNAVAADIGVNKLGIRASCEGELRFAFPVVIMSGVKR
jgi:SAM-dependent methyltransferase